MISVEGPRGPLYGRPRAWHLLYLQLTSQHPADLRAQLEALVQASHDGADPADVERVQAALWQPYSDSGLR